MADLDFDEDEKKESIVEEVEEQLIFMPVVRVFSDYPVCTDQHPDDFCRLCTDDCPCKPRPPPVPTRLPRPRDPNKCTRCKERIIVPTKYVWPKATPFRYTVFGDLHYHRKCFRCNLCDRSIFYDVMVKENENVFKHGGDVVCQKCDVKLKSLWCNACKQPIRFHRVNCEDKEYHRNCLKCTKCGKNVAGHKRSSHHQNKPYCGNCLTNLFARKCKGCNMQIPNGIQYFYFRGEKYHFGCFKCTLCSDPLISPGGPDKPVMVRGNTKLCLDCFPKYCSNCGIALPRGSGNYEVDEVGVVKCLECAHIGYNRKLKGKKLTIPEGAEITGGLGIGDITYGDSESEESQQEDEEDEEGGTARVYRGRRRRREKRKTFSTWGPAKKPEPPKRPANELDTTELNTIYIYHNYEPGGEPIVIDPNYKDEDEQAEEGR